VICNDSGGMHLAAAVGTPVVAVFGLTDPHRTGPLGEGHRLIAPEGVRGRRDVPRASRAAAARLRAIEPERVVRAVEEVLRERGG
jgi:ADP-heptose:LPS heptosyltransferase